MTPVLVDTSVWRRYFGGSAGVSALADLLDEDGAVLIHPFVLGELVLGGLSAREESLFARLPCATLLAHEEVLEFVRRRSSRGAGSAGSTHTCWRARSRPRRRSGRPTDR